MPTKKKRTMGSEHHDNHQHGLTKWKTSRRNNANKDTIHLDTLRDDVKWHSAEDMCQVAKNYNMQCKQEGIANAKPSEHKTQPVKYMSGITDP